MTPTLLGRWQTRIFLLGTVGVLVTLPFAVGYWGPEPTSRYYWILFYVGLFGLAWDVLYQLLQKYRWDRDWPGILQFFAANAEIVVLVLLIEIMDLPNIRQHEFSLEWFALHYSLVWVAIYLSSWVVMRLLFPRWRFRGGKWIGGW
ncbi:MAG: hypothetical protein EBE86_008455 [Hormoscilla sp. GUM202]|nr:hypothetical protein [Hormoscilla sp. GUM202]